MDSKSCIVVYFGDDSYCTVPAHLDSTAQMVCITIIKRRNMDLGLADTYGLFLHEDEERLLELDDCPLEIQVYSFTKMLVIVVVSSK